MKHSFIVIGSLILLLMTTRCNSSAENLKNAEFKASKANQELIEATKEYLIDMEAYKIESEERIAVNQRALLEFKGRIEGQKKEALDEYNAKVAALEAKNTDLSKKLADYRAKGKEQWLAFKIEFNHDMAELGKSFNALATKSTK